MEKEDVSCHVMAALTCIVTMSRMVELRMLRKMDRRTLTCGSDSGKELVDDVATTDVAGRRGNQTRKSLGSSWCWCWSWMLGWCAASFVCLPDLVKAAVVTSNGN